MFDKEYKEALENMKLTDDFKAALASRMKSVKSVPRARLVLISVAAVLVLATSAGLAANVATNGRLFQTLFGGQNPQTTEATTVVTEETTDATTTVTEETTVETAVETTVETTVLETTVETTATPTPTVTPKPTETTAATTAKPTAAPTTAPSGRVAPVVRVTVNADSITVSWDKITSTELKGYKVVASINDSTPQYSENGYYTYITDRNTTSCTIKNGASYNSGDFKKFSGGQAYYFSVTALYGNDKETQKIAGNAIQATMPGTPAPTTAPVNRVAPNVRLTTGENCVTVSWDKITSSDLVGYKVVASINVSTPMYSENGYYTWITNADVTSCTINNGDSYENGDFSCFTGGQAYYFSVTAVYGEEWTKIAGNVIQETMPGATPTEPTTPTTAPSYVTPSVSAELTAEGVKVSWNVIDLPNFEGYKVVHSATNENPAYPGDGFDQWITERTTTNFTVTGLPAGTYWFSVTALYTDGTKIAGNAVKITIP